MKEFANTVAVKCHPNEKYDIESLMYGIGYSIHSDYTYNERCWFITYEYGLYAFHSHSGAESNFILDHYNEPLIRDIVSVCSNETWQKGEPMYCKTLKRYEGVTDDSLANANYIVSNTHSFRRPTVAEICNHYGYHIEGNNIVKNIEKPTLEERVAKLEEVVNSAKPCCEPETWKWFTTDGIRVNVGDVVWYVGNDFEIDNLPIYKFSNPLDKWDVRFTALTEIDCEEYVIKNKPFEPVDVVITCNSPEELRGLWHVYNCAYQAIKYSEASVHIGDIEDPTEDAFTFVDELLKKLNLRK